MNRLFRVFVACVLGAVLAFDLFTSNAWALGGFSRTCRSSSVVGSTLTASCQNANGIYQQPSSINLNSYTGNIDGSLSWNDKNFIETCRGTGLKDPSTLVAECKRRDQSWANTSIDLDAHIANIDGNLRYE